MEWAEAFGIGELQLTPREFWRLTPGEFWIKHAAFTRAENRARADTIRLALSIGQYKPNDRHALQSAAAALTQYPLKRWTLPEGTTPEDLERARARQLLIRHGKNESHDDASRF